MFPGALEPPHLLLLLVIVLIVFGPGKIPDLGRSLGEGIREFRRHTEPAAATPDPGTSASAATQGADLPATTPARRCVTCHRAPSAGDRFCGGCGEPLPTPAAGVALAPAPAPAPSVTA